jgi:hypothetical protein
MAAIVFLVVKISGWSRVWQRRFKVQMQQPLIATTLFSFHSVRFELLKRGIQDEVLGKSEGLRQQKEEGEETGKHSAAIQ